MEIILQKDVKNLGKAGDRVRVKPGFARNYLLPNKMALAFNEAKSKEWEHKKHIIESKKKQAISDRKKALKEIAKAVVKFQKESRSEGLLFGSVTPFDISKQLEEVHGIIVDKKDIKTAPLKEVGKHQVLVELDSESKTEILVEITRKVPKEDKESKEGKVKGFFSRFKKDDVKAKENLPEEKAGQEVALDSLESKEKDKKESE